MTAVRRQKRKGDAVTGWLALNKPAGMTSTQAVAVAKRIFNAAKAGHGGTLDPLADGVLPVAFGEATKTVQWAMDAEKEYEFTIRWGISTASQDAEGEVIAESDARPAAEDLKAALVSFLGVQKQVPPRFSAIKVAGARAYDLAREGEVFELEGREVEMVSGEAIAFPDHDHAVIRVVTGKGFYVRALARDLASRLGCEGHICQLRRLRVGQFILEDALTPGDLEALQHDRDQLFSALRPLQSVLGAVPQLDISAREAGELRLGRAIVLLPHILQRWKDERRGEERLVLAVDAGEAVALGEVRAGRMEPVRVFSA
jgi:tRNA pseudouridine55 synthase